MPSAQSEGFSRNNSTARRSAQKIGGGAPSLENELYVEKANRVVYRCEPPSFFVGGERFPAPDSPCGIGRHYCDDLLAEGLGAGARDGAGVQGWGCRCVELHPTK